MKQKIENYKKWQEKFLSLLLASTISFSANGCSSNLSTSFSSNEETTTNESSIPNESTLIQEEYPTITEYLDYFSTINIIFDWEEYYITYETIEKYLQSINPIIECQYTTIDNINITDLIVTIKNNTEEYLKKHPEYSSPFENDQDKTFQTSLISVLVEWQISANSNTVEDFHKMQSLKIVSTNNKEITYEGKYDSSDNLIILNFDAINSNYQIIQSRSPSYSYEAELTLTIAHELNHLRQHPCECQITTNLNIYPTKYTEDAGAMIIESSAESSLYNEYNKYFLTSGIEIPDYLLYTYNKVREYESLLWLLGIFNNQTIDNYYKAIFNGDINALHNFYGVETLEDIYQLYKIIYAIDSSVSMTNLSNIIKKNNLNNKENIYIADLEQQVGTKWRASFFQLILKQMINYTQNNPDFSLEENIVIFNHIKNNITREIHLNVTEEPTLDGRVYYHYTYDEETVKYIKQFEQKYVDFLTEYYQTTEEEIRLYEKTKTKDILSDIATRNPSELDNTTQKLLTEFPLLQQTNLSSDIYNEYELFLKKTENINPNNSFSSKKRTLTNNLLKF